MVFEIIQSGNALPFFYKLDPTATFESGQIGQLKLIGNDIVVGLSDGTAPLGIIDDVRTTAFSQPVADEVVIIQGIDITTDGYNTYNGRDSIGPLDNSPVIGSSFTSDYPDVSLITTNGNLILPAGAELNYDADGDGIKESVRMTVSYVYHVADLPGGDTTLGSGKVTIWFQRGIFATDQYDTTAKYPLNAVLFVNSEGKLTTSQTTPEHPGVAMVTGPPGATINTLEFLWL